MENATLKTYTLGFLFSLGLTLGAYLLVVDHAFSPLLLTSLVIVLAIIQLIVQLLFFLHIGREKKPRWNLVMLISTISIILLILLGSLWIMSHLNYRMTPSQMNTTIMHDEGMHM